MGQKLPLSLSPTLKRQTLCFAGRATEGVERQRGVRQWKEKRGLERAKWRVGFRQMISVNFWGRGCLHSADGFKKGRTASHREGHETSADIILCLPPVTDSWGQMQVLHCVLFFWPSVDKGDLVFEIYEEIYWFIPMWEGFWHKKIKWSTAAWVCLKLKEAEGPILKKIWCSFLSKVQEYPWKHFSSF